MVLRLYRKTKLGPNSQLQMRVNPSSLLCNPPLNNGKLVVRCANTKGRVELHSIMVSAQLGYPGKFLMPTFSGLGKREADLKDFEDIYLRE